MYASTCMIVHLHHDPLRHDQHSQWNNPRDLDAIIPEGTRSKHAPHLHLSLIFRDQLRSSCRPSLLPMLHCRILGEFQYREPIARTTPGSLCPRYRPMHSSGAPSLDQWMTLRIILFFLAFKLRKNFESINISCHAVTDNESDVVVPRGTSNLRPKQNSLQPASHMLVG